MTHAIEHSDGPGDGPPAGAVGPPPAHQIPVYVPQAPNKFVVGAHWLYARTPRWVPPAAIATCFAGAASYVLISNPTDAGAGDLPGCLVKITTGLDCPGCGGTRAFYYLLTGNVPEAARHHAVAVFAAAALASAGVGAVPFVGHDLDADNLALLRTGVLTAVLHHDLRADLRAALTQLLRAHRLLPGAPTSVPSAPQVVTPWNVPPRLRP